MRNFEEITIKQVQEGYLSGEFSCEELVKWYLERIEKFNFQGPELRAMITVNPNALEEARRMDEYVKEHHALMGAMHGVPTILKDNFDTKDMETTAGSIALKGWRPPDDAFVTERLRKAGAVFLGKSNLHEFAIWGETISSILGQTLNPYDLTRTPGGSSGGTGAAIASNMGLAGLGTDTINSIRSPSSANSLVGIRPTLGLVSRTGIVPYSLTQDTAGPICRTVEDAARTLAVIAGYDPQDDETAWSAGHVKGSYADSLREDGLKGKRIGVLESLFGKEKVNESTNQVVRTALKAFVEQGAVLIPVKDNIDQVYLSNEVSVHLDDFRHDLDSYLQKLPKDWKIHSMKEILEQGLYHPFSKENMEDAMTREVGSLSYLKKLRNQKLMAKKIMNIMAENNLDAMVYPHQQQLVCKVGDHQLQRNGVFCSSIGFPSICVPAGFAPSEHAPIGVPVGMEIMGRPWTESLLIEIAYGFEQHTHFRKEPVL